MWRIICYHCKYIIISETNSCRNYKIYYPKQCCSHKDKLSLEISFDDIDDPYNEKKKWLMFKKGAV